MAGQRMPMLETAGIHTFFNGPESFTPDDRYYLGEAPELGGYWVAAGYNSIGIVSSGGAGMALAQWIVTARRPSICGRSTSAARSRSSATAAT
jgi:glycine/D-amino acid oxidase-like deaminating enzyme